MHGSDEPDGGALQINFAGVYVTRLIAGTDVRGMNGLVEAGGR